jgi:hypothetical protein
MGRHAQIVGRLQQCANDHVGTADKIAASAQGGVNKQSATLPTRRFVQGLLQRIAIEAIEPCKAKPAKSPLGIPCDASTKLQHRWKIIPQARISDEGAAPAVSRIGVLAAKFKILRHP